MIDSRSSSDGAQIRRRRECLDCGKRFTSYERIDDPEVTAIAATVELEPDPTVRVGLYECQATVLLRNGEQRQLVLDFSRQFDKE